MPKGSLSVLLVGRDEARMGQARDVLRALGEPRLVVAETQPAEAAALSAEADVAMMVFGGDEEEGLNYLQKESERTPRPVLFALLNEQSEALMRRVLRAGADEVLFAPLASGDLMRPLLKVSEALRRSARRKGGKTFSVTSMAGGVGVTTVCANLGLALQAAGGVRVVLMDLALQGGGLSDLLGAEPERGILALAHLDRKPDSIGLEAALTKPGGGVPGPRGPARRVDLAGRDEPRRTASRSADRHRVTPAGRPTARHRPPTADRADPRQRRYPAAQARRRRGRCPRAGDGRTVEARLARRGRHAPRPLAAHSRPSAGRAGRPAPHRRPGYGDPAQDPRPRADPGSGDRRTRLPGRARRWVQRPVRALAELAAETGAEPAVRVSGLIAAPDGSSVIRAHTTGVVGDGEAVGRRLAHMLLKHGGAALLDRRSHGVTEPRSHPYPGDIDLAVSRR